MPSPGVEIFHGGSSSAPSFTTAVSLHSHTEHSLEGLGFLPDYVLRVPLLSSFFRRSLDRYCEVYGQAIDFANAFWTPPLSASDVLLQEIEQIEGDLGLRALISITDHDNLLAAARIRGAQSQRLEVALSLEWSVPFGGSLFHFGIHNLPPPNALALLGRLQAYTADPQDRVLSDLLITLHQNQQTLVVLNHPRWDLPRARKAGPERHLRALKRLVEQYGKWIHALEINAYQSWEENTRVLQMANEMGFPVVAGGDRHGAAPNAMLNLTNTNSLADYISEVREGKRTALLIMPAYRESFKLRRLRDVSDVLSNFPQNCVGRQEWSERILFALNPERIQPLSVLWACGRPPWMGMTLGILRLMGGPFRCLLRPAFRGECIDLRNSVPQGLARTPAVVFDESEGDDFVT